MRLPIVFTVLGAVVLAGGAFGAYQHFHATPVIDANGGKTKTVKEEPKTWIQVPSFLK